MLSLTRFEMMSAIEVMRAAIEARKKAWKYLCASISFDDIAKDADGYKQLQFEARSTIGSPKAILQVYFWEDRWIWIDARESSKTGWNWEWTSEGRVAPDKWGKHLAKKIEDSFELSSYAGDRVLDQLEHQWSTYLATGPRRLHPLKA